MKSFYELPHTRALETLAIWDIWAPDFAVGALTLARHRADEAQLIVFVEAEMRREADLGQTRARRDNSLATLNDLCMRGCRVISGALEATDSLLQDVRGVTGVRGRSQNGILTKSRRLLSLWERANERHAGMLPALPPLVVGQTDVGQFETTLKGHESLLQEIEDDRSQWNTSKRDVRELVRRLDRNNKRWFKAWQGHFPVGAPELEALRQVTTKARRNPSVPGQAVIVALEAAGPLRNRLKFDAPRGKVFKLLYRAPGAPEFMTLAEGLTSRIFEHQVKEPGSHAYQVISSNGLGEGEASLPRAIEVAATKSG